MTDKTGANFKGNGFDFQWNNGEFEIGTKCIRKKLQAQIIKTPISH